MKLTAPRDEYIRLAKRVYPSGVQRYTNNNPMPALRTVRRAQADMGHPTLQQHRRKAAASVNVFPNAGILFAEAGKVHFRG
ncbi:hypothetical protein [Bacteroides gallinarum]|uniref:hypothetical protein n=1 Tax=Bacteroides gallinarum TaxID=376806 RepID=UPI0003777922|nr:hypothetical protein [Bacteroides gallinarum]